MEEKDFPGLCRLLAASKARVNLPETILFHHDVIDLWVYSDAGGGLRKRQPGEEGVRNIYDACRYFQEKATQLPHISSPVCYLLFKASRSIIDSSQIDSLLSEKKEIFNRVLGLQEYKEPKNQGQSWFTYHIRFEQGKGYATTFLRMRGGDTEPEICPRLQHKAKDTVQVVLSAIEEARLKRVKELSLDLMQDSQGMLWVMGSSLCILCLPGGPSSPSSLPVKDVPLRLTSKLHKPEPKAELLAAINKEKSRVVFKRGQLRSLESNLNSPLRILSPSYPPTNPLPPEPQQRPVISVDLLPIDSPLRSFSTAKTKSFLIKNQQKPDRFFNPNFQELLVMGYLKRHRIFISEHPNTFRDDFYKDLETADGDSQTKLASRLTIKLEGVGADEGQGNEVVSDSDLDSKSSETAEETEPVPPPLHFLPTLTKRPIKRFNTTKRQLYIKTRDFTTAIQPVLTPRKPFFTLKLSHRQSPSLADMPQTTRAPYGPWSHHVRGLTKWQSVNSLKS